ncbi:MAG TPA: peptide deformylase [Lapillicoccus sp.]|uniref:peptide deformylase n=1 Tax=Lapillicoccus sp. TaxID=1909287 RepID=UPI002F924188
MAVRPIVITGEPVLHRPAALVEAFDDGLRQLVADMFDTMDAAHGVGLAAPQIAVPLRLFVYEMANDDDVPGRGVVINPMLSLSRISTDRPDPDSESEGCLSVPGESYPLKRADQVSVIGFDADGEELSFRTTGWFARVMQHEFDHLNGLLYVDRLDDKQTRRARKTIRANGWGKAGNSWMPGVDRDPFGHDDDHEDGDAFLDATGHDDRLV